MQKTLALSLGALLLSSTAVFAQEEPVLNVYNWSDYIAEDTIPKFEAETGIKVNYDVFDSNELVEAKLLAGSSGYDVVVPSGFFLERQAAAGVFKELDKSKLPNLANMDPDVMAATAAHDPDNKHSVDYMWGTTAIGYNVAKLAERLGDQPVDTWDIVFKPDMVAKLADCGVTMLDAPAEVMASALNYLGLDPNSESPDDLKKAEELMMSIRPSVRISIRGSTSTISAMAKSASPSAIRATCSSPRRRRPMPMPASRWATSSPRKARSNGLTSSPFRPMRRTLKMRTSSSTS